MMGDSENEHSEPTGGSTEERALQVLFEVELSGDCACPLSNPGSEVENVHKQINDGVCHAEATITDGTDTAEVVHSTNEVGESCLCHAFSEVDCVPRIRSADDDGVLIETYISDRSVISELVGQLRSAAERVRLRRLTTQREDVSESDATTVDFSHLTTKQREAAMMAVTEGYYQTPRQITLDELADALDISKSALSQRLNAVESKLLTAVFAP